MQFGTSWTIRQGQEVRLMVEFDRLSGTRVAILATDGVEQVELTEPMAALREAAAEVHVVSPREGRIRGWKFTDWGDEIPVDSPLARSDPNDYDALVLPGGQINPDKLRMDEAAVSFVRAFVQARKPIGAICHGPWTLIEAGGVQGRRMTSYTSLKTDLRNAGADWVDEPVVVDDNLITSRNPDDLTDFCDALVERFARAKHGTPEPAFEYP